MDCRLLSLLFFRLLPNLEHNDPIPFDNWRAFWNQVYHKLAGEREDLKVAGCWIHARRPFADIIKSIGLKTASGTVAQKAYDKITEILHLDNEYDDLSIKDRKTQRQKHLSEKVDAYFAWVKLKYSQITHNSTIGKALAYSINQEKYLRAFLSDGSVSPDNNYAEQIIRPFTIDRKNFILMASDNGAKAVQCFTVWLCQGKRFKHLSVSGTALNRDSLVVQNADQLSNQIQKIINFQCTWSNIGSHSKPCSNAGFGDTQYSWLRANSKWIDHLEYRRMP